MKGQPGGRPEVEEGWHSPFSEPSFEVRPAVFGIKEAAVNTFGAYMRPERAPDAGL
jgi:hypothetical protein